VKRREIIGCCFEKKEVFKDCKVSCRGSKMSKKEILPTSTSRLL
jgi:hypothetical protein